MAHMTLGMRLAPRRVRGTEFFDDPGRDDALAQRSLADIARTNRWFGGTSAVIAELRPFLAAAAVHTRRLTLLDVGTGAGDIPQCARAVAAEVGVSMSTIGLEITPALAAASAARAGLAVAGDARAIPLADHSVDIVTCSQVLHHFDDAAAQRVIGELHRVARMGVIIAEIRRCWAAAGGVWLASWMLGFHPVSRHDGVTSVLRGFRASELGGAVKETIGRAPVARDRRGFRVTASWRVM